jgi:REP element-mobilizing transposase RayT
MEFYEPLKQYSYGIIEEQKCHFLEMNNVSDHVHILFELHRTATVADVVMHVKKGSSRWIKQQDQRFAGFDWQDGYGAFSLGRSQRDECSQYILGQQAHHAHSPSFQDEFRRFLHLYEIAYDERYVWD